MTWWFAGCVNCVNAILMKLQFFPATNGSPWKLPTLRNSVSNGYPETFFNFYPAGVTKFAESTLL